MPSTCVLCGLLTTVVVYLCVPETRGLSLEEVDHMYMTTSVRQSMYYKPHSRAEETELRSGKTSSEQNMEKNAHQYSGTHVEGSL